MKLFAIKDLKSGFENPFVMPNEGSAVRSFGEACKNTEAPMYKYPEDYELWIIGDWDHQEGDITTVDKKCIAYAHQYSTKETK